MLQMRVIIGAMNGPVSLSSLALMLSIPVACLGSSMAR